MLSISQAQANYLNRKQCPHQKPLPRPIKNSCFGGCINRGWNRAGICFSSFSFFFICPWGALVRVSPKANRGNYKRHKQVWHHQSSQQAFCTREAVSHRSSAPSKCSSKLFLTTHLNVIDPSRQSQPGRRGKRKGKVLSDAPDKLKYLSKVFWAMKLLLK